MTSAQTCYNLTSKSDEFQQSMLEFFTFKQYEGAILTLDEVHTAKGGRSDSIIHVRTALELIEHFSTTYPDALIFVLELPRDYPVPEFSSNVHFVDGNMASLITMASKVKNVDVLSFFCLDDEKNVTRLRTINRMNQLCSTYRIPFYTDKYLK